MKKYIKPELEASVIGTESILVDSLGVNGSHGGSQLGKEREDLFGSEEETPAW